MPTLVAKALCRPCETLFTGSEVSKAPNPFFPHHNSLLSLRNALDQKCRICTSIWARLPPDYRTYISERNDEFTLSRFNRYFGSLGRLDSSQRHYVVIDICPQAEFDTAYSGRFVFALELLEDMQERLVDDISEENSSISDVLESRGLFWYNWCRQNHKSCSVVSQSTPFRGPSRLVEIDKSTWSSWKLVENAPSLLPNTPYASLSHCWGQNPLLTLNSSTISKMKLNMPITALPRTFQDAITVAKYLSISHIWIDCLCILQDSAEDWQHESAQMKDIYSHAEVNIAATAAAQGSDGCFFRKEKSMIKPWKTLVDWAGGQDYVVIDVEESKDQIFDAPLNQRAWVVQERILSPRILHIGRRQLFWQCRESFTCEDWPKGIPRSLSFSLGGHWSFIEQVLQGLHEIGLTGSLRERKFSPFELRYSAGHGKLYFYWTNLVELYTKCKLTNGDDKLIALSGLAQLFKENLDDDVYLAGLWRKDLLYELLWRVESPGLRDPSRAPSWSWASMNGAIKELGRQYAAKNDKFLVELIEASTVLRSNNPFGQSKGGFLTLKGIAIQGVYEYANKQLTLKTQSGNNEKVKVSCYIDENDKLNNLYWYLPIREQIYQEKMIQGLVLKKISQSGKYTRVGYWNFAERENLANSLECFGLESNLESDLDHFRPDMVSMTITIE